MRVAIRRLLPLTAVVAVMILPWHQAFLRTRVRCIRRFSKISQAVVPNVGWISSI